MSKNYHYMYLYLTRTPDQVLKMLTPYFQMDYYLPRSFLTSLKLEMIPDIVSSGFIPPDVTLASIFYYIRTAFTNEKGCFEVIHYFMIACINPSYEESGLTSVHPFVYIPWNSFCTFLISYSSNFHNIRDQALGWHEMMHFCL